MNFLVKKGEETVHTGVWLVPEYRAHVCVCAIFTLLVQSECAHKDILTLMGRFDGLHLAHPKSSFTPKD